MEALGPCSGRPTPAARRQRHSGTAAQREQIRRDVATVEPLLRARATVEIDTRRPLAEVVAAVLQAATTPR